MITPDMVLEWRRATLDALRKQDDLESQATKPYHIATCTPDDPDLLALRLLDSRLEADGFGPLHLVAGYWHSSYGPLPLRVFVCHMDNDSIQFNICVHIGMELYSVAEYKTGPGKPQLTITQTFFDLARAVLPS